MWSFNCTNSKMAAIYCRRHRDCCTSFGTCQKPQSLSAAKEVPARRHQGCDAFVVFSGSSVEVQWCPIHGMNSKVLGSGKCQKQLAFLSPLEASLWGRFHGASDSLPHLVALDAAQAIRLAVPRHLSTHQPVHLLILTLWTEYIWQIVRRWCWKNLWNKITLIWNIYGYISLDCFGLLGGRN